MPDVPWIPTVDELRKAIDRGQAGDKTPGVDPAAAPLGTDAEAGGHPPTPAELAAEAEAIRRDNPRRPTAGGEATESLRAAETRAGEDEVIAERNRDAARPSEGGGVAESARAAETIPSREDEAAGALSDDPAPPSRRSAEP
jgi:hypothetical protein